MTVRPRLKFEENSRHNIPLPRLDAELQLPDHNLLLVGDGSGQGGWTMGGGWAVAIIERHSGWRKRTIGGWDCCSIIVAELSAYLQAMMVHEALRGSLCRRQWGRGPEIVVLTDNQAIVTQAPNALAGHSVGGGTNPIWAGIRRCRDDTGAALTFRFIPRLSITLNWAMDQMAGRTRIALAEPSLTNLTHDERVVTLEELNPAQ